jgi:hypothetical protein
MLNTPWIDPRNVDFTDAFNPLARPRWYATRNPFLFATFADVIWQALRNGKNVEPRILVAPDPMDQQIAAGATFDQSMSIEPGTWLYGLNCSGDNAAGFYIQITDAVTGAQIFSQQVQSADYAPNDQNGKVCYLASPRYFVPPSYPVIRIVNLANAPQVCSVNLFTAVEIS